MQNSMLGMHTPDQPYIRSHSLRLRELQICPPLTLPRGPPVPSCAFEAQRPRRRGVRPWISAYAQPQPLGAWGRCVCQDARARQSRHGGVRRAVHGTLPRPNWAA